jgi:hypothetical protein
MSRLRADDGYFKATYDRLKASSKLRPLSSTHTLVGASARAASRLCSKLTGEWKGGNVTQKSKVQESAFAIRKMLPFNGDPSERCFFVFESKCFCNLPALFFVKF